MAASPGGSGGRPVGRVRGPRYSPDSRRESNDAPAGTPHACDDHDRDRTRTSPGPRRCVRPRALARGYRVDERDRGRARRSRCAAVDLGGRRPPDGRPRTSRAHLARSAGRRPHDLARAASRGRARGARTAHVARGGGVGRVGSGDRRPRRPVQVAQRPAGRRGEGRRRAGVVVGRGARGSVGRDRLRPEPGGARRRGGDRPRRRRPGGAARAGSSCGCDEALASPPESLAGEVVARWSAVSATLGRRVAVVGLDGARLEGLAASVDALGRLIVETVDGPAAVVSEEVEHLR